VPFHVVAVILFLCVCRGKKTQISLWKSVFEYGILSIGKAIRFKGDAAMRKLEYTFKTDTLFKMLFVQHPELLKKLVADLLGIP